MAAPSTPPPAREGSSPSGHLTGARVVLLLVALVAAGVGITAVLRGGDDDDSVAPNGLVRRGTIVPYLGRPGGGEVVVPEGIYRGGSVDVRRDDWLVLRAATPGRTVVDLRETGLRLDAGTNKVVFVGFRFVDGMVRLAGVEDVHFWYCEFTSPPGVWAEGFEARGGVVPTRRSERGDLIRTLPNPLPTAIRMTAGEGRPNVRVGVWGSDLHDVGDDGIYLEHAEEVRLEGLRIWDVDEERADPGASFGGEGDWFHNDGIQTAGGLRDVELADSWVGQKVQWASDGEPVADARFRRLWLAGSRTFGQINGITGDGRLLRNSMEGIRAFANGQRAVHDVATDAFRTDFVDGRQVAVWPRAHHRPGRFEIPATDVDTTVPPGVELANGLLVDVRQVRDHPDNPANVWRRAHPYDAYREHLGLG